MDRKELKEKILGLITEEKIEEKEVDIVIQRVVVNCIQLKKHTA